MATRGDAPGRKGEVSNVNGDLRGKLAGSSPTGEDTGERDPTAGDGLETGDSVDSDIEVDDTDANLLIAIAEMDAEAAEAYRIAAEHTDEVHFRTKLEEFRGDHLRHVAAINRLLDDAGIAEVSTELDEESSALTMLAASMGVMGSRAALLTMLANERLTEATYQAVLELPFEEEVTRILEAHLSDEKRHLQWLAEQEPHVRNDEDQVEAGLDV